MTSPSENPRAGSPYPAARVPVYSPPVLSPHPALVRPWTALVVIVTAVAACGGAARMPKGPPPEYEEYDAGTPVFEGDGVSPADVPVAPPAEEPAEDESLDAGAAVSP